MRPLTRLRPKPLLPLGRSTLVDHAIERVRSVTQRVAVNAHHGADQIDAHLSGRVHLSIEPHEALGTAGAIGHLAGWLGDDDLIVVNGDTWCPGDLAGVVDGWDRDVVRVVVAGQAELTPTSRIVASLYPARVARSLAPEPSGLYEVCWRPRQEQGRIDVVGWDGPMIDCGTPKAYLAANLMVSGGRPVIGDGALVEGSVIRTVVWPGARVWPHEVLVDAIRTDSQMTVLIR